MIPLKMINIMKTEVIVETDRGNLNFLSMKVAAGKNSIAIKNARKKGAKMLCPNAKR